MATTGTLTAILLSSMLSSFLLLIAICCILGWYFVKVEERRHQNNQEAIQALQKTVNCHHQNMLYHHTNTILHISTANSSLNLSPLPILCQGESGANYKPDTESQYLNENKYSGISSNQSTDTEISSTSL